MTTHPTPDHAVTPPPHLNPPLPPNKGRCLQGRDQLRFSVKCSFLEIYNENVTDLLRPSSGNLNLREDMKRGCYVDNLSEEIVLNGMFPKNRVCNGVPVC